MISKLPLGLKCGGSLNRSFIYDWLAGWLGDSTRLGGTVLEYSTVLVLEQLSWENLWIRYNYYFSMNPRRSSHKDVS